MKTPYTEDTERPPASTEQPPARASQPLAPALVAAPVAVLSLLLIVATWFQGAFALKDWGLLAMFGLALLAASVATGGVRVPDGWPRVALAAVWAFAGWSLLSAVWAESAARALEGGGRALVYATLATAALVALPGPKWAARIGAGLIAGLAAIAVVTFIGILADGKDMFLAGRLDDPVGYRNATASLFTVAFWPLIAIAAVRGRNPVLRSGGLAAATLCLGLAFLTQSRGALLGFILGGVVAIALGPDRLRRTSLAVVVLGGTAVASSALLTPYDAFRDSDLVLQSDISTAALALALLVLAAAAVGLFIALFDGGLRMSESTGRVVRKAGIVSLTALTVVAGVVAIAVIGNPAQFASDKYDEFKQIDTAAPGETRLGSVGGQRYDLWRISLNEFSDHPLLGAGEGSYQFGYYAQRRTDRNLTTPHSLPFQLLAELGFVGLALFVVYLVAVVLAIRAGWRRAPPATRRWASAFAAAGAVVVGQSLVDWIWLIPGIMGLGLFALTLAAATVSPAHDQPRTGRRWARWAAAGALGLAVLLVGSLYLSDYQVRKSRAAQSPAAELDSARTAESLNPRALPPYYLQAGALEALGRVGEARDALQEALRREPRNFVTYALLGDLELRAGHSREATDFYRAALRLNPRDVGLQELSRRSAG